MNWVEAYTATATRYWTQKRTDALIGDKPLLLMPLETAPLLRLLGLLHRDGSMPPPQMRKFRQINHMLLSLEPPLKDLMPKRIIDAACGGSYLTLILAWYFKHRWNHQAQIVGIDRNAKLLKKCAKYAQLLDLDVTYVGSSVRDYQGETDVVISLHGCDTATDEAIALGLRANAKLIAVVPCCQAELAAKVHGGVLGSLWASPHLKRLAGSTITDAMRMLLLRSAGYDVTALEFVPTEHTPKNTLIRASKRRAEDLGAAREYQEMKAALNGAGIALETMFTFPNAAS